MLVEALGDNEWLFDVAVAVVLSCAYLTISRLFFPNEKERAYVVSVRSIFCLIYVVTPLFSRQLSTGNIVFDMHFDRTLRLSLRNELGHIPFLLEGIFVYSRVRSDPIHNPIFPCIEYMRCGHRTLALPIAGRRDRYI
jgi:hypothetical protein